MENSFISNLNSSIQNRLLKVEVAHIRDFPANSTYGPHAHSPVEINYINKGSCQMQFNREIVRFDQGDCMVIFPNVDHYFFVSRSSGCQFLQLKFDIDACPELIPVNQKEENSAMVFRVKTNDWKYLKFRDFEVLHSCISRIIDEFKNNSDSQRSLLHLYLTEFFILLSRQIKAMKIQTTISNHFLKDALTRIHSNYHQCDFSLASMSNECGVSLRYLRKIFLEQVGTSPLDYVIALRIEKAKELVMHSSLQLKEIGYATGFSSPQYFCRMFKSFTGYSPKIYRDKVSEKVLTV
jgi:AraC-like DNA-binding protein